MRISTTRIFDPPAGVYTGDARCSQCRESQCQSGFTLIELLIVVAILAVLAALIAPNIGTERRVGLQTEAGRLAQAVESARIAAVTQNRQWGLRIHRDGYAFEYYELDRKRWQPGEVTPFERRTLPEDFDISVSTESRSLRYPQGRKTPPILILSSGEMTPFSIELFSPSAGNSCTISSDGMERTGYACA